ncbi:MAG: hypothetical protein AAF571_12140 [Verrucomicrobiota bacterium]
MAKKPTVPEIARLIDALRAEKIRFILVGMSAALLQGVPGSTLDTDIWIGLPSRQYMKLHAIVKGLGGSMASKTAGFLKDDTLINFVFKVDGLQRFPTELKRCRRFKLTGRMVNVLPLKRILKSKETIRRPKDLTHIALIKETIRLNR